MLIATFAICGIPGFSGFFSKDEILWKSFSTAQGGMIFWIVGAITAGLTAFYMFRLIFLTFFGKPRYGGETARKVHESPKTMLFALVCLAVLSVAGGWIGIPESLGGGNQFEHFMDPVFAQSEAIVTEAAVHYAHSTEYMLMAITIVLVLVAIYFAYLFYVRRPELSTRLKQRLSGLHKLIYNKYYVDEIYQVLIVNPIVNFSLFLWKVIDVAIIDGLANGLAAMVKSFSSSGRVIQTGYLRNYALLFVFGVIVVLAYFMSLR
ncbi:MAG: NADH-quinone oxidoreductase subunit L, partial [candidate division Zixibacteria bacterium]|nr:NADH-quinone oxidoreductase subunit L [candidate division Zixibacteria bacterium]